MTIGPRIRATAAISAAEAAGIGEHGAQATGGFVTRRRPPRRFARPPRGGRPIIREADEIAPHAPVPWRSCDPSRAQMIDLAIAAADRAARRSRGARPRATPAAGSSRAAVNGAAVALRRRSPLGALTAVVIAQALAHDADLRHRPAVAVPGRADPDVHGRLPAAACGPRCSGYAVGARLRRDRLRLAGASRSSSRPAAQFGFYLARVGDRAGRCAGRRSAARRPSATSCASSSSARSRPAPPSSRSARGSPASCTTPSRTASRVMVLQAGGVRRLLGSDPAREREREALAGVEETGRQAVGELHRMLGILAKTDPGAELAPSPSLRARRRARRPGARRRAWTSTLSVEGEPRRARAGPRHVRLPDRAGGAHERAALRARRDAST